MDIKPSKSKKPFPNSGHSDSTSSSGKSADLFFQQPSLNRISIGDVSSHPRSISCTAHKPHYVGLANPGQICYMNCSIQMMYRIYPFSDAVLSLSDDISTLTANIKEFCPSASVDHCAMDDGEERSDEELATALLELKHLFVQLRLIHPRLLYLRNPFSMRCVSKRLKMVTSSMFWTTSFTSTLTFWVCPRRFVASFTQMLLLLGFILRLKARNIIHSTTLFFLLVISKRMSLI